MKNMMKTYTELCQYSTYADRVEYLMMRGRVGNDTFGVDRVFNQMFYHGEEWNYIRSRIITRDNGCDLGLSGHEIIGNEPIYVHHINPLTIDDIKNASPLLFDPENLICCRFNTHQAIHYGLIPPQVTPIIRVANDTCPWKK